MLRYVNRQYDFLTEMNVNLPNEPHQLNLDARSKHLRHLIVTALQGGKRGHVGSSMSLVEIFRVLYDHILMFDPNKPDWEDRDRCILSKGHGCLALYAILADKGFFPVDTLKTFCHLNALLGGHPESKIPGVEASTGALGHGLSVGVGMAIAAKMQKRTHKVFVIMGDGELNEGSVWEAALCAAKHELSNLVILIDRNRLQSYGPTEEILALEPLSAKWEAFGFSSQEVDGHNVTQLRETLKKAPFSPKKPSIIICNTVKGKGIPIAENVASWHHKASLSDDDIQQMLEQLNKA